MVPEVLSDSFQGLKSGRLSADRSKLSTSRTSWSTYELWCLKNSYQSFLQNKERFEGETRESETNKQKKTFLCIVWSTGLHLMAWRQYLVQSLCWISSKTVLGPERNKSNRDRLLILSWKTWTWTGLTKDASAWEIPAEKSSGSSVHMFSYKHTDENINTASQVEERWIIQGLFSIGQAEKDNYSESNGRAPRMVWTLRCWLK